MEGALKFYGKMLNDSGRLCVKTAEVRMMKSFEKLTDSEANRLEWFSEQLKRNHAVYLRVEKQKYSYIK